MLRNVIQNRRKMRRYNTTYVNQNEELPETRRGVTGGVEAAADLPDRTECLFTSPDGNCPEVSVDVPVELKPIGSDSIDEWNAILAKYKAGKRRLDSRLQSAENWWLLRNRFELEKATDPKSGGFRASTSWLHNVISSKHADAIAAYPVPNILPRGEEDRAAAELLSKTVPVILRQNSFDEIYDLASWQKLKTGTGVYKIIWDSKKLGGLGDISVTRRDLLCLFWEPGVCDIQDSGYVFDVEMVDAEEAERLGVKDASPGGFAPGRMPADDRADMSGKVALVDVYYKKDSLLHYCKYCGRTVIYSTENDPERRSRGLYDHGLYPFVFDVLFPVEGSPAGYGYVDICANSQMRIDLLTTALLRNTLAGATPRYFTRLEGGINEEELLNTENALVHVTGSLGEDYIRSMPAPPLSPNHLSVLRDTVDELRETSGNTETSTGNISGGVTAAAAISALQDAAGKGSRAAIAASYRAYAKIIGMVIELIRQFYDAPRRFRVTGGDGAAEFVSFCASDLMSGAAGGPGESPAVFDIDVEPERKTGYSRLAQNELAMQLYSGGFFNPALARQSLQAVDMMEFDGKQAVRSGILENALRQEERT